MAGPVQATTGAGGGVLLGPLIVFFWNWKVPDYPMDATTAAVLSSVIGTFLGSLLPELWGLFRSRFDPPPPAP